MTNFQLPFPPSPRLTPLQRVACGLLGCYLPAALLPGGWLLAQASPASSVRDFPLDQPHLAQLSDPTPGLPALPTPAPAQPIVPVAPEPFQNVPPGETPPPVPPLGYPNQPPTDLNPADPFTVYRLGPGDSIFILVERFPDLNTQATVSLEGKISVPLIGTLTVTGLTLEEVQELVRTRLNRFVIDPQVRVSLGGLRASQVTLVGEVVRPGYYPVAPGSQLSAVLLAAGGTTAIADLRSVVVRRTLVDGSMIEQRVDLFTPLQNGQALPTLRLQDGDAVVIPRLEVGTEQTYDRTLVARSTLAQAQINIRVLSYPSNGIGNITLPNGSTFVDALVAIAPNPDQARLSDVAVIRFDPEQGKAVTQNINARSALLGDVSQNIPLQNNDVIVVGRSLIARLTYALGTFTQPFRDVLGFLLFFDSLRNSASNLFGPLNNNNRN